MLVLRKTKVSPELLREQEHDLAEVRSVTGIMGYRITRPAATYAANFPPRG